MTKKELINRWKGEDGNLRLNEIIKCLATDGNLKLLAHLEMYNGKWDFRGAVLSVLENEQRLKVYDHDFALAIGSLKVKGIELDCIDFSYADISYSNWQECVFKNCLFEELKAK